MRSLNTRDLVIVALFAALTGVGAFIRIPIPIVPFTLQSFFCILSGLLLGAKKGMLSQLLYVVTGLIGIPVFTQGGGIQYIFQPTFGYLIGFILGAYVIGRLSEKVKILTIKNIFFISLIGLLIVYILGLIYMYFICNIYFDKAYSVFKIIQIGFLTSIGGDLVLTYLTAVIGVRVIPILKKM